MGCYVSCLSRKPPPHDKYLQPAMQLQAANVDRRRRKSSNFNFSRNDFLFSKTLGEGGFGIVRAAQTVSLRKDVGVISSWFAVKEIKKVDIVHHKSGLDMVYGELQALKKLQHPYIVTLHFAFNDKVSCFLVLDLLCGGDLRQYCKSHTVFDESHICFIGLCICSALEYMHSKYVLHRDVKPENILLDDRGYPYLTDFGVAYVHTDMSKVNIRISKKYVSRFFFMFVPNLFIMMMSLLYFRIFYAIVLVVLSNI